MPGLYETSLGNYKLFINLCYNFHAFIKTTYGISLVFGKSLLPMGFSPTNFEREEMPMVTQLPDT
tara:strand:+ start:155 stop:349 length:195 start_codon:yes stop_codon:yes gene_type:complete